MRRSLLVLPAVLPWTALVIDSAPEFVFAWGILNTDPLHAVSLSAYLLEHTTGLPDRLLAWPVGVALYLGAAGSNLSGLLGREDRRLTAGLFALAGLSALAFTLGIARRNPAVTVAVPVGTLVLWWLAWRSYAGGER